MTEFEKAKAVENALRSARGLFSTARPRLDDEPEMGSSTDICGETSQYICCLDRGHHGDHVAYIRGNDGLSLLTIERWAR